MTNREWLAMLSNEDLAKFVYSGSLSDELVDCRMCVYLHKSDCEYFKSRCIDGITKWLEAEHEEDSK